MRNFLLYLGLYLLSLLIVFFGIRARGWIAFLIVSFLTIQWFMPYLRRFIKIFLDKLKTAEEIK